MLAKRLLLAVACVIGIATLPAAEANAPRRAPDARLAAAVFHSPVEQIEQAQISAAEAIARARAALGGGEPMGVPTLQSGGGRPFYVIRWRFPNEVVDVVRVDAITGQVMR